MKVKIWYHITFFLIIPLMNGLKWYYILIFNNVSNVIQLSRVKCIKKELGLCMCNILGDQNEYFLVINTSLFYWYYLSKKKNH